MLKKKKQDPPAGAEVAGTAHSGKSYAARVAAVGVRVGGAAAAAAAVVGADEDVGGAARASSVAHLFFTKNKGGGGGVDF